MPAYNCEKYIEKAIQSVLSQTYPDFELIIVDDGSVDNTHSICERYSAIDKRVRFIKMAHGGVSAARNFGIGKAEKENVIFLDSDDEWDSNLLKYCADNMQKDDDLFVFGIREDYYSINGELQYSKEGLSNDGSIQHFKIDESILHFFTSDVLLAPYNKVFKRSILKEFNILFNTNCVYLEDLKFNLDYLSHISEFRMLNKNLYFYRLVLKEKQILKRAFKGYFLNADELYESCLVLSQSKGWDFPQGSIFVPLLTKAYLNEFLCHIYEKDVKTQNNILRNLNENKSYNSLLNCTNGKFFLLLKICKALGLKNLQIQMIKKRYW